MYGQPMYGQPMQPMQPVYQQPVGFVQQQPTVVIAGQQNQGGSCCPVCNSNTGSRVDYEVGGKTWMWCIVLFFFTGICCWIPFVCEDCKERVVECATCNGRKG